jgi:hypothetical protein
MLRLLYRPRPFQRAQICGDRPLATGDMIDMISKLKPVKYIEGLIKIKSRENTKKSGFLAVL